MIISPIIPIWLMVIICIVLLVLKPKNIYGFIRQVMIVILLFVINLRIMIQSDNVKIGTSNLDVLFVIDNTISMLAEDMKGNTTRLEVLKEDCQYIMDELDGSKFSVITFNNKSNILIPYTTDMNMASQSIKSINVMEEFYARGSSLNTPLDNMLQQLKSSNEKKDRTRIVFFISDGEITSDEKLESYSELKEYVADGAVLGYGTKERRKNESY